MSEILTVSAIKAMDECHRKKLRAEELLAIILTSAEEKNDMLNNLNISIAKLNETINFFREEVINNSTQIVTINSKILLEQENNRNKLDIEDAQRRSRMNNVK